MIKDCVFIGNSADAVNGYGGGLSIFGTPVVSNCVFQGNSGGIGGGMSVTNASSFTILNCTFINNSSLQGGGVGLFYSTLITMKNTIIAFSAQGSAVDGFNGSITASHCNVYGNKGGDWSGSLAGQQGANGNISQDPLFVDGPGGDVHLCSHSPCRDAGDNMAPGLTLEDFEGDPRINGGAVDMGADEFHAHLYCTGNPVAGNWIEIKCVATPNSAPVGLCISSGLLVPPLPSMWGDWHLSFPIMGPFDFGAIPAPGGVLIIPGMIPQSPLGPYSVFMQAIVGSELTNPFSLTVK